MKFILFPRDLLTHAKKYRFYQEKKTRKILFIKF